jgi:hypothetical protein
MTEDRRLKRTHPRNLRNELTENTFQALRREPFGRRSAPKWHPPSRAKGQVAQMFRREGRAGPLWTPTHTLVL